MTCKYCLSRARHAVGCPFKPPSQALAACKHCGQMRSIKGRGLCGTCYGEVRDYYPPQKVYEIQDHEPTAEEVEWVVAEQRACLPDWWVEPAARRVPYRIPRVSIRSRRVLGGKAE